MGDVGIQIVDRLYASLMIDDEWAVRRERGFTWWGYRLAQHVEAGPVTWSDDRDVCVVRIWTEVARDVDSATDPSTIVAMPNLQTTMSAIVWDPATARIIECCTAAVHEENLVWLSRLLATAAVLQNTAAHSYAHAMAQACGGVPDASNHPTSGQRPAMDDLLNLPAQVIVPAGKEQSRFTGALAEGLGRFAADMGCLGTSDATGVVCEVPFTGERPLITQPAHDPDNRLETSLVQVFTDQPHPDFGSGALIVMRLPVSPGPQHASALANELNLAESRGELRPPLLGAWCPDAMSEDGNGLAFSCFLPNVVAEPGLLENQLVYQNFRSRFTAGRLFPES